MFLRVIGLLAGSGNSQEAHIRSGYPDYGMGPGVHHPSHPAHMGAGGQMRPGPAGQYHDPNMPPHQQVRSLNQTSQDTSTVWK